MVPWQYRQTEIADFERQPSQLSRLQVGFCDLGQGCQADPALSSLERRITFYCHRQNFDHLTQEDL